MIKNRKEVTLSEIMDFKNGLNFTKSDTGERIKIVGVSDFKDLTELKSTDKLDIISTSSKIKDDELLKDGDLLFVRSNGNKELIGRCLYFSKVTERLSFSGFTIRGRIKDKNVLPAYIAQLARTSLIKKEINKNGGGTNISNLSQQILNAIVIKLPEYVEQIQIVKTLSTWDNAIQTTEKLLENSRQQKKALMQRLLSGENWKEVKLIDIGKVITGNTPPKSDSCNYGNEICWATADDFNNKYIRNTKIKLSKIGANKARIVPKGSILVTCIASIGKNAIADIDLATNQQINSIIVNSNMNNEFIYYLIENNKHKLFSLAGTTAVPIVNKTTFEKMKFMVPALNEQQKIANILSTADQEIETLQRKLECLKLEKGALMQKLL